MILQVNHKHYFKTKYDTKGRFCSYWHQINEIILLNPRTILEIGIGNGLVSNYLKQRGLQVTTIDIDQQLNPDKVGSVLAIPFPDKSFEVVACFEVLEHIPFSDFSQALKEIYRVTTSFAILSIPDCSKTYRLFVQLPFIGEIRKIITIPSIRPEVHKLNGEHYWEINKAGFSLKKIISYINEVGFEILKTFRVFEKTYHRFFVLSKKE